MPQAQAGKLLLRHSVASYSQRILPINPLPWACRWWARQRAAIGAQRLSLNLKAIFKLAQLDALRVHLVLPGEAFSQIARGTTVDVQPEVPANARCSAKVRSVDRPIDAASGCSWFSWKCRIQGLRYPLASNSRLIFREPLGGPGNSHDRA